MPIEMNIKNLGLDFDPFSHCYLPGLNLIYGEASTGKSTFALSATIAEARQNKKVIFLDTRNSFSIERFIQLAGPNYKSLLDSIFVLKIKNFSDQQKQIKNLPTIISKTKNISLIIIDSITHHFKRLYKRKPQLSEGMLISQLKIFDELAKENLPIIITAEVYTSIPSNEIKPIAGSILKKFSATIIKLEKSDKLPFIHNKKLIVEKPYKKEFFFEIKNNSISKIMI